MRAEAAAGATRRHRDVPLSTSTLRTALPAHHRGSKTRDLRAPPRVRSRRAVAMASEVGVGASFSSFAEFAWVLVLK